MAAFVAIVVLVIVIVTLVMLAILQHYDVKCKHKWKVLSVIPYRGGDGEASRSCLKCNRYEIYEWARPEGRPQWAEGGPFFVQE